MRDIGKNIRDARVRAGLTQDELAEKLFVTRQTVSNYETGRSRPDVDTLSRLAEILSTEVSALLYGLPAPEKKSPGALIVCAIAAAALMAVHLTFRSIWYSMADTWERSCLLGIRFADHIILRPLLSAFTCYGALEAAHIFLGMKRLKGGAAAKAMRVLVLSAALFYLVLALNEASCWITQDLREMLHYPRTGMIKAAFQSLKESDLGDRLYMFVSIHTGHWLYGLPVGAALWIFGFPERGLSKGAEIKRALALSAAALILLYTALYPAASVQW